jgi:hypothetical protein
LKTFLCARSSSVSDSTSVVGFGGVTQPAAQRIVAHAAARNVSLRIMARIVARNGGFVIQFGFAGSVVLSAWKSCASEMRR